MQGPHITPCRSVGMEQPVLRPIASGDAFPGLRKPPLCTEWGRPTGYIGFKSRICGPGELIAPPTRLANRQGLSKPLMERYPYGSQVRPTPPPVGKSFSLALKAT